MRQRFPEYTPAQVASYLKDNAQQRTSPDPNNTWGHGFIVLPPNPPQLFGPPSIDSVTAGVNSLTILWSEPSADGDSTITAYDLRHIETAADETVDANWTVVEDVWTSGSGTLSYELTGLGVGTQYDVQVRAVNSDGDGPWSTTTPGTPSLAETPCSTGGAVTDPANNLQLVSDCDTLLSVRDTLAGDGTLNWAASTPITTWDGIAALGGTPQRVTKLYLGISGLSGTIPADLESLTGLTQLSIFDTQIMGTIPPELGNLTNLTALNLFRNGLTGSIPVELDRLINLKGLELYGNELTGPIPTGFGNLVNLEALHLDTNQLTGPIPSELGSLVNLRWLTLHDNHLRGEIPSELVRLTNLEQLYLSGNQLTDCVPAELRSIRETDRTHRLKEIGIPYCDVLLSGLGITPADLRPEFDSYVTDYTAAATASSVTVSPVVQNSATFQYLDQNNGVLGDADGRQPGQQVDVPVGTVTTIRVRVTTGDGLESRDYTIEVTGLGGLAAPSIRQVTSGIDSLTVSWREPSQTGGAEITAYDLRHIRSDAPSKADPGWTVVQDAWSGSGALGYELTGLEGGVAYDIQVRAVNATGDGPWSATVTGTAKGTVPGAPTALTATANGQTQIDLSWSAPSEDGGTAVTGYRIEVSPDGSAWADLVADTLTTTTSYSHTGLLAGSTRHYRVSAINSEGNGPASNVARASTAAAGVPGAPSISRLDHRLGSVIVSWRAPSQNGGSAITSFDLRYIRSDAPSLADVNWTIVTGAWTGSGPLSHELTSLADGTSYKLQVRALNAAGEGPWSATATANTVAAPTAPDLVVDTPTVSSSAPTAGASFTLSATVRNQGNGRSDLTTLRYYQSADSAITTGDSEVGADLVSRLDAAESSEESVNLAAPSTPGTYYYGACVGSVSDESDTTNNCSQAVTVTVGAAPAPDLVVDTPTVSESAPTVGASFTLSATVRNQGSGRSDSTRLRYYQSSDSTITTGDTEVDTDYVSRLDASESGDESVSLTAPSTPGTYHYGACVDSVSDESDTTNNCSPAVTVTVGAAPAPDLVVDTPTISESAPTAGARFTLSATVRNQGSGLADSTTLRYYQSADSAITTGDSEVGADLVSRLDAAESSEESVNLAAPSTPGTYYYGACVDAVSGETDTTNNCSPAVTVTVGAAPAPDLVVDTPTVSESALTAGARFTLSATVRNQGSGSADSTTLRYYQSADSAITTGDTGVGTDSVSSLAASGSGNVSVSLTAPSTPGTHHYGACVDSVSDEFDTANNCSSAVTVTVGAAPAPDLVVDTPTVSESAPTSGASFTLNATVRNKGSGRSDSTRLRYYQSTNSTITTEDTEVDTDYVSRIDASESGDESISLNAPSTPGTYYYGACVDSVAGESDTTNNCSRSVTVTVGTAPAPDLVVDTPTVSESAPAAEASFKLSATVRNQGNDSAGITTLHYYRSTDSAITAADMQVGTDDVVFHLAASETSDKWTDLTAPSTPGTYYYGACVDSVSDETDTANNCSSAVTLTVGAAPAPDLVVDTPTVSESALTAGASFTLSATVRNQGNGRSDLTTLRYYQSSDSTITTEDTEVDTDYVSGIDASESGDESISLNAPSTPGTHYYGACVDSVAGESDTTNNCSQSVTVTVGTAPAPNLVVDTPTVSESAPATGARFTLSATVRNQGNGRSDLTTLRYYQSSDSTITTGDTEVDTDSVSSLDPSRSGDESISLTAPSTPGTYHYGACVDAVSGESDTTNNCSPAVTVTVGAAPAPDLVVNTPTASESAPVAGASITLSATVRNQGNDSAGITTLHYYRSTDSAITAADMQVGTDDVVFHLAASETSDKWTDLTAPSTPGTYYYGACVDSVSDESDTTNNCSAAVTVTVGALASVPGALTELTATANGQTQIDLSWTAPTDDGGSAVTGYKIEVSTNRSNWSDLVSDTQSTATSYSHTGLTAGSTRHYRVSAINSAGTGPASNVVSDTTASLTRETSACTSGGAVPDAANNPGLISDCETLLAPKNTLRGTGTLNWSASIHIANWDGITIGGSPSRVTRLRINRGGGNKLTGKIPASLGSLDRLTHLDLRANGLTGSIPPELGDLEDLVELRLWGNELTGSIPGELGNLDNLDYMDLGNNKLTGSIPSDLGNLGNLGVLGLYDNQLSGAIPPELGRLSHLHALWLNENLLTGMPAELGRLTDLGELHLHDNRLTGPIPPELGNLSSLWRLTLNYNSLEGPIPQELGNLTKLKYLSINGNRLLAGCVPTVLRTQLDMTYSNLGNLPFCDESPGQDTPGGAAPGPDLVVDNTILSSNLPPGRHWSPNATVRNQGDGSSASTTLRYYRSTDPTITTSDTQVGTDRIEGLAPFGKTLEATGLNAPTTPGTYYYGACVDAVAGESDTTNNCSSATEVTVRIVNSPPRVVGDVDDLTVELGERFQVDISGVFSEPDGEQVGNYGFTLRTSGVLRGVVDIQTGILSLTAVGVGVTIVAVDASDIHGNGSGSHDLFSVTVVAAKTQSTATAPDAPTGLTATASGQTEIDLSWTAPSHDGGSDITGYKIEVSANGSNWADLVADTDSTSTSYSHTGLTAGTTRHYRVSAINSAGTSDPSSIDSATTDSPPAATAPDAPTGLTATADGQTEIDLSWTAPSDDGGADITGYRVEVSSDGSSWSDLESDTRSTATSYSHTGLTAGSTRYYRVSAINSAGTGDASNVANATIDSAPVPVLTTNAVTGAISECSGVLRLADQYEMTIEGTLTASRAVRNVVVIGEVEGETLGADSVGYMAAGETVPFTISSTVSLADISSGVQCSIEFTWAEIG